MVHSEQKIGGEDQGSQQHGLPGAMKLLHRADNNICEPTPVFYTACIGYATSSIGHPGAEWH